MTSPFGRMLLVVDPAAARGRSAVLPRLRAALDARGLEHDAALAADAGEAAEVARGAVEGGRRFVVVVGGDTTVHGVVNGLVDPPAGPRADGLVLGVVAAGTGCDFARTFGLDRSPEQLAAHLDGDTLYPIDVGRVRLTGPDGGQRTAAFANVAEAGYGALVTQRVRRLPRLLGRLRHLLGVVGALRRFDRVETTVTVDHTEVTEPVSNVVMANGQFFGGGMKVAPRALPDDGLYNVQVWNAAPREVFLMTQRVRVGDHLPDPQIREWQSSTVGVTAATPLLVEADGEILGTTPATFDLLPRAVSLKV